MLSFVVLCSDNVTFGDRTCHILTTANVDLFKGTEMEVGLEMEEHYL
jgi:hypothetical protein